MHSQLSAINIINASCHQIEEFILMKGNTMETSLTDILRNEMGVEKVCFQDLEIRESLMCKLRFCWQTDTAF